MVQHDGGGIEAVFLFEEEEDRELLNQTRRSSDYFTERRITLFVDGEATRMGDEHLPLPRIPMKLLWVNVRLDLIANSHLGPLGLLDSVPARELIEDAA